MFTNKEKWKYRINFILIGLILININQFLFSFVQNSRAKFITDNINIMLRQELTALNPYTISKTIGDLEGQDYIKCATVKYSDKNKFFLDLRYNKSCASNPYLLNGKAVTREFISYNGHRYFINFITINDTQFYIILWLTRFLILLLTYLAFHLFIRKELNVRIKVQMELETAKKIKSLGLRIAHDIRSPLAALKMAILDSPNQSNDEATIIKSAAKRIQNIANDLLDSDKNRKRQESINSDLAKTIKEIVREKKIQINDSSKLDINAVIKKNVYSNISPISLERVLSNLINNSIDASNESIKNEINITLDSYNNTAIIILEDCGKGIPKHLIQKLKTQAISFGKEKGNGIGLSSSIEIINDNNGELEIDSQVDMGTKITITLPISQNLDFDKKSISNNDAPLHIHLDDDPLICMTWKVIADKKGINLVTLNNFEQLLDLKDSFDINTVFYLDYELGDDQKNGVEISEIISSWGYSEIYLTSGHDLECPTWVKGTLGKTCPW